MRTPTSGIQSTSRSSDESRKMFFAKESRVWRWSRGSVSPIVRLLWGDIRGRLTIWHQTFNRLVIPLLFLILNVSDVRETCKQSGPGSSGICDRLYLYYAAVFLGCQQCSSDRLLCKLANGKGSGHWQDIRHFVPVNLGNCPC